jgi:predicted Zn-dependent protease
LADPKTVNAFACLAEVFITAALYHALETHGQLAGVLGHEVGRVIERHGNKRLAKEQMFQGLAAAGGVAGGDQQSAQMAQAVAQMVSMKYGREDELESDKWGVRLMEMAGYDPRAMIGVMKCSTGQQGYRRRNLSRTRSLPTASPTLSVIEKAFPNSVLGGLNRGDQPIGT